jgi:hypothetical protein
MTLQSSVLVVFAGVAGVTCAISSALADEAGSGALPVPLQDTQKLGAQRLGGTSKQYDPRLPPVLPGELIVTEEGERMRVWSSSGPVPVNPPPQPQAFGTAGSIPGVLVDARSRRDADGAPPPVLPGAGPGAADGRSPAEQPVDPTVE